MSESFILFFLFLDILFISPDGAPRAGIKERRDHLLAVHHSFPSFLPPSFSAEITNEQTRKKGSERGQIIQNTPSPCAPQPCLRAPSYGHWDLDAAAEWLVGCGNHPK